MESLYDDIMALILLKLKFKEIHIMSLISKRFNNLISSDEYCGKFYEIKYGKIHCDKITLSYLYKLQRKKIILKDKEKIFYWSITNGFNELMKRTIYKINLNIDNALLKFVNIPYVECLNILLKFAAVDKLKNLFNQAYNNNNYVICKALINYVDETKTYSGNFIKYCYSDMIISEADPSYALYLSCKYNQYKKMKHILNLYNNIDVNYVENHKASLDHAIIHNNLKMVRYLLKRKAKSVLNDIPYSAGDKIIRLLLKYNIYVKYELIAPYLILLSKTKSLEFLLKKRLINNKDELLKFAIDNNKCDAIKLLLDYGTEVSNNIKYTLEHNKFDTTLLLCHYTNNYNEDDLFIACEKNKFKIAKYLVENGVKITNKCFHIACKNGDSDMVTFLIENGADINGIYNNYSPIFIAMTYNKRCIVKILLDAKVKLTTSQKMLLFLDGYEREVIMI